MSKQVSVLEDTRQVPLDTLKWLLEQAQELQDMKVEINGDYSPEDLAIWNTQLAAAAQITAAREIPEVGGREGKRLEARVICLVAFDITVTVTLEGVGHITSSLHDDGESREAKAALDGVESMILAHAVAGIDVNTPAYLEGIETAVDAIWNQHGDSRDVAASPLPRM